MHIKYATSINKVIYSSLIGLTLLSISQHLTAQNNSLNAGYLPLWDRRYHISTDLSTPLFSVDMNGREVRSTDFIFESDSCYLLKDSLRACVSISLYDRCYQVRIRLGNLFGDTLEIENLVPLERSHQRPYFTGHEPPGLGRDTLFRPGHAPIGLIVPDNAWEMGLTILPSDRSGIRPECPGRFPLYLQPIMPAMSFNQRNLNGVRTGKRISTGRCWWLSCR